MDPRPLWTTGPSTVPSGQDSRPTPGREGAWPFTHTQLVTGATIAHELGSVSATAVSEIRQPSSESPTALDGARRAPGAGTAVCNRGTPGAPPSALANRPPCTPICLTQHLWKPLVGNPSLVEDVSEETESKWKRKETRGPLPVPAVLWGQLSLEATHRGRGTWTTRFPVDWC